MVNSVTHFASLTLSIVFDGASKYQERDKRQCYKFIALITKMKQPKFWKQVYQMATRNPPLTPTTSWHSFVYSNCQVRTAAIAVIHLHQNHCVTLLCFCLLVLQPTSVTTFWDCSIILGNRRKKNEQKRAKGKSTSKIDKEKLFPPEFLYSFRHFSAKPPGIYYNRILDNI